MSDGLRHCVAIVGMAGRFPGAASVAELWDDLREGVESMRPVTPEDLTRAGLDPSLLSRDGYVGMCAPLEHAECFDAAFFGYHPREAELIDPQQRALLECAWSALESAGYGAIGSDDLVGVFAGVARNTYLHHLLVTRPDVVEAAGEYQSMIAGEKDFPATRIGYKLDLRGPCINVQTACSTSGVAIHLACQSLLTGDCDMALAGGARILVPHGIGYDYDGGGILSSDGHCRAFDASADGTIRGSGVAFVVLKRYPDAVAGGDTIHALIRATAVNNDGAAKVGFTAPGIQGQTAVIADALALAGVEADSIGYVEAHGTGTRVGDPIEVAALTKAFRETTDRSGFCGIGSVKTNIGHLDAAAAVAGLIKATLAVEHGVIPPSLHFREPNPQIDFDQSPFYVVAEPRAWTAERPRRAGVSSFGLGGTNAHMVIEEAPERDRSSSPGAAELLVLSARSREALSASRDNLARHLAAHPDLNLGDAAYTLQTGRARLPYRFAAVAGSIDEATEALAAGPDGSRGAEDASVVFLFPGGGAQHAGMGSDVYASQAVYREHLDACLQLLRELHDIDLSPVLLPRTPGVADRAAATLTRPSTQLTALFSVEVSMARLLMSWGLEPRAMIGHSLGEYAAAHLAGVLSLEDALALVAKRGGLFEEAPPGGMLSVPLAEAELRERFPKLSIAAVNKPDLCVLSGETAEIDRAEASLSEAGVDCSRLHISVPAHSAVLAPVLDEFSELASTITFSPPRIPYVSNVTGDWIRPEEATDPDYWVRHLRQTVRFDDGLGRILEHDERALVEVGPGRSLSGLARQHELRDRALVVTPSMRHPREDASDTGTLLAAVGRLWAAGAAVDWKELHGEAVRHRVPLPTYPFERVRHWIGPASDRFEETMVPRSEVPTTEPSTTQTTGRSTMHATEPGTGSSVPAGAANGDRSERLLHRIKEIFADLSGLRPDEIDTHASFLDLGFESLSLTQGSMAIKSEFSVDLRFRQLLEGLSTPALLAEHLDEELPAEEAVVPHGPPSDAPVGRSDDRASAGGIRSRATEAPSVSTDVTQLIAEQLRLMSEQLRMLGAHAGQTAGTQAVVEHPAGRPATSAPAPTSKPSPRAGPEGSTKGPWRPIDKSDSGALDDRRREHLADLTARLCARTRESKRWTQRHRARLADPRTVAGFRRTWKELVYPVVVNRSKGSRVWDIDGNEYIDVAMGFGVNLFGHSPDFITEAVRERLDLGVEIGPQTPLAGEVAELVGQLTGHQRIAFSNTGSEAVLAAIRMARTVTGRTKIVTFDGDYHGIFDEVLARPVSRGNELRSVPVAPGIPDHMVDAIVALPYGDPASLDRIEEMADDLALVLVEPVQSRHPDLQPVEFLRSLRDLTARRDVPLVFDEMITGFRCHPGGAQALFGVQADIATYGKVIGGGFPIGVVAGKSRYMDALDGGMWSFGDGSFPETGVTWFAGTFVRHPVALTAARAALTHMASQGPALQEGLNRKAEKLVTELNRYYDSIGAPIRLERFSSFFLVKFLESREYSSLFYYHLRDRGVHMTEGRSAFLSTAHSDADLDRLLDAFKQSARAMQEGGFLPGGREPHSAAAPSTAREIHAPVTEGQEEIWLAATAERGAECAFNLSNRLELFGDLDEKSLSAALDDLVARHEALRTTFSSDGRMMVIADHGSMALERADLTRSERPEQEVEKLARREVETPFDLVSGPLARAVILRLAADHHLLFLTVHHIVCDGWSCGVLLRDLGELYGTRVESRAADLDPPRQISEYARAQELHQSSSEAGDYERYWVDLFADGAPRLNLPTDFSRPPLKTYAAAREEVSITSALMEELSRVAATRGCTSFTLLLSGFEVFLARLTGQEDFVVGVSAAGQLAAGSPDLVGHCVSLLPLRTRVDPTRPFEEHLASTRTRVLDAFERQNFTFGTLLKKLKVPRDASRLPLVDVVFNMDLAMADLDYPGLETRSGSNPRSFENFELFVNIVTTSDGTRIECTYNTDLFRAETMRRRLEELVTLLGGIASSAETESTRLPLLPDGERELLLDRWNRTDHPPRRGRSLADMFESQVDRTPDADALVAGSETRTYAALNEDANRIAHELVQRGVGRETLVGVCLPRGPDLLAAILGVLKAGAGYLPLDPGYPRERLRFMLDDCGAPVVVTETGLLDRLPSGDTALLALDAERSALEAHPPVNPDRESSDEDVAYVIYTSGSTGAPKGVVIENRNAAALLQWAHRTFGPEELTGVLFATSVCFDLSVFEMFLPLTTGGRVIVARNVLQLPELPSASEVTLVNTVPSAMSELAGGARIPDGVETICLAGEPLPASLVDRLYQETDVRRVFDLYGPSEDTTYSTWALRVEGGPSTIGRPIDGTRAYVLDRHGSVLPVGVPGELYLGGAGVARGYLNRPELTSDRFLPDPFVEDSDGRLYRTGDIVRYLPDGNLEFHGRRDTQVKLRGYRIELGEIESVLREHPDVDKALVVVHEGSSGYEELVGYVVRDGGPRPSVEGLGLYLDERLPAYMIPRTIMALDAFPRLPNGKLDRAGLPAPRPRSGGGAAVATPLEEEIARIWSDVLITGTVAPEDDFFDLGGSSLQAVRVLNRIEQDLGAHLGAAVIFEHPTVRRLAAHLSEQRPHIPAGVPVSAAAGEREEATL